VCVWDLAGGGKRFFWRRDGQPGLGGLRSAELPLYGAERVAGWDPSRLLFVAEGEKAALASTASAPRRSVQ
ncbi:MAG: hypothetical protein JOZ15_10590, partial [Acidobacteria bacterium]|nr:hypothetical protein [Acidobacteriota bacterium]